MTALYGLVVPAVVGWLTADYSPSRQYISEMGAVGAPHAFGVNLGIFLPTGLLALGAVGWLAVALPRGLKLPVLLLLGIGLGNLGAVAFPCDLGCPAAGSARQGVHNLLGAAQYLSGGGGVGEPAHDGWSGAGDAGLLAAGGGRCCFTWRCPIWR